MFEEIYKIVRNIPKGKVMTYGDVAFVLSSQSGFPSRRLARVVGYALHANKDVNTPCHRVVNKEGRLAPNFAGPQRQQPARQLPGLAGGAGLRGGRAFDGWREQKMRLAVEGVTFVDEMKVDLDKHKILGYKDIKI